MGGLFRLLGVFIRHYFKSVAIINRFFSFCKVGNRL